MQHSIIGKGGMGKKEGRGLLPGNLEALIFKTSSSDKTMACLAETVNFSHTLLSLRTKSQALISTDEFRCGVNALILHQKLWICAQSYELKCKL